MLPFQALAFCAPFIFHPISFLMFLMKEPLLRRESVGCLSGLSFFFCYFQVMEILGWPGHCHVVNISLYNLPKKVD